MATTGFLKVSWLLLYCVMSSTRINNSCQQNGLLRFKEIIDSNRIGGHRLADMNMIVFEKDVFNNLQFFDLCLRIKVCASIDIKKQNTQRSCRLNCGSRSKWMPFFILTELEGLLNQSYTSHCVVPSMSMTGNSSILNFLNEGLLRGSFLTRTTISRVSQAMLKENLYLVNSKL